MQLEVSLKHSLTQRLGQATVDRERERKTLNTLEKKWEREFQVEKGTEGGGVQYLYSGLNLHHTQAVLNTEYLDYGGPERY